MRNIARNDDEERDKIATKRQKDRNRNVYRKKTNDIIRIRRIFYEFKTLN